MAIIINTKDDNVKYSYLNIFPDQFKSDKEKEKPSYIKNTLDYLSIAENEGISLKYDDKYPVIDDTVIGGVLPEVEVKGYANGGQTPLLGNKAKLVTHYSPTIFGLYSKGE